MAWYTNFYFVFFGIIFLVLGMIWLVVYLVYIRRRIKDKVLREFQKKNFIRAYFFNQNGQLDIFPTTIHDGRITYGNKEYIIKPEFLKYIKSIAIGFWIEGCPFPVDFNLTQFQKDHIPIKVDASSFKDIMNNKIIKDIISQTKAMQLMMILLFGIAVGVALILAHQYGFIDWVMVQNTPQGQIPP